MKEDLIDLLERINSEFSGKLISTGIEEYISKLIGNSVINTEYQNDVLAGFIAFYANNTETKTGYMSMLAVDKSYRGNGVAEMLIVKAEGHLKKIGFKYFDLEVLKSNASAIALYAKKGFSIFEDDTTHYKMRKSL
ncbi:N-acetyltransferase [uncultured Winogradskyella sp.]|uniref:GNAT family N-acetyltransferase n=1 Tax=uncultured Winogradskyella sp. TaxID=395353 RepID=UPI00261D643B|nr:GNAT family N-acetyltransferase [uncultured Winogradskyella sp.]